MIPAVCYYRMSSDRQEASIPQQVQAVERYAADNGYRIIRDYRDEGISGDATEKRVQFRQMVADGVRGDFQAVLAWDQDRLGRFDAIEAGRWLSPLRDAGVRIVTVNQGEIDLEDFGGVLIYSVQQGMKHQYLKDLAKNASRGLLSIAKEGRWAGGDPPLGYRIAEGRLVVDEEEAQIVRRIFHEYDSGYSLREIANRLNVDGIVPTLKRRRPDHRNAADLWSGNALAPLILNPAYVGTYRWNARQHGKYARVRNGSVEPVRRGEKRIRNGGDVILIEDHHPAIIDRELFARVGEKTQRYRSQTSKARNAGNVLAGICRCGYCGGNMIYTMADRRHNRKYVYCSSTVKFGRDACERRSVREDILLPVIVGKLRDRILHPENAQRLRSRLESLCRDRQAPQELDRLRRDAIALEDEITKARRRVVEVDSDMLDVVQQHLRELRSRHESMTNQIAELEWQTGAGATDIESIVDEAMGEARQIASRLDQDDPRMLREALREIIERADLFVEPTLWGKRRVYQLERGVILLRSEDTRILSIAPCRV